MIMINNRGNRECHETYSVYYLRLIVYTRKHLIIIKMQVPLPYTQKYDYISKYHFYVLIQTGIQTRSFKGILTEKSPLFNGNGKTSRNKHHGQMNRTPYRYDCVY